ncbi:MAG: putative trypsin-like serine protease [Actinomycetia bacterium]|nr:putative trypsin-like serine protease [Actinomycetes bacterium]
MRMKSALVIAGAALVTGLAAVTTTLAAQAGEQPVHPTISGGHTVSSAPWAAQVDFGGVCSGTIIAPHWALSAWHCLEDESDLSKLTIRVGSVTLHQGTAAKIKSVQHRGDLALIELDRDVSATYQKLASANPPIGATVDIYGWGYTCDTCPQSTTLKTTTMTVATIDPQNGSTDVPQVHLGQNGGGYAEPGDSGGPAMYNGLQFGVLLGGDTASDGSGHEAYSSVPSQSAWIQSITGAGGTTPPPGGGNTTNYALNKATKSKQASCSATETPDKAVNGSVSGGSSDKWCSGVAGAKSLEVDLGTNRQLSKLVVKHAGAGGESTSFNTKNFVLETSAGGGVWTTAATVSNNTASTTTNTVTGNVRWIRITTTDAVARIYEFEAY